MATLDKTGYRKYLTEKGFKDDEITYDPTSNSVMAKGKFFGNAAPEADGSTYNTRGNLESMYKAYQTQNMPTYQDKTNTLLDQAQTKLGQPAKPFQYNAQSDPLYLNALQAAQTGAATQQGNTLAKLRSMGQGKSSYSEGVANQIGQQAVADVNSKVLPQLTSQAYQRYMDEQTMNRQNFGDTLQLAGTFNNLGQQQTDNDFRNQQFGEQQKQNNLDAAYKVGQQLGRVIQPKSDYGNLYTQDDAPLNLQGQQIEYGKQRDQVGDARYDQQFQYQQQQDSAKMQQQAQQFAASQGLDWARLNQAQQQFVSEQSMKQQQLAADQTLRQQQLAAENNPNSLDNQYKQAQIDSMKAKTPEASGIDEYDLLQVEALANQAGITPQKADPAQIRSFIADLKGKYGWSLEEAKSVESYLNSKKQTYDQEQAAAKAAEKPKKFGYRPFGG